MRPKRPRSCGAAGPPCRPGMRSNHGPCPPPAPRRSAVRLRAAHGQKRYAPRRAGAGDGPEHGPESAERRSADPRPRRGARGTDLAALPQRRDEGEKVILSLARRDAGGQGQDESAGQHRHVAFPPYPPVRWRVVAETIVQRVHAAVDPTGMVRPNREWVSASNRPPRQPYFRRAWPKAASTHTPHTAFLTATEPQNGTRTARGGAPPSSQGTPWPLRQQGKPPSFLTDLVEFLILRLMASSV